MIYGAGKVGKLESLFQLIRMLRSAECCTLIAFTWDLPEFSFARRFVLDEEKGTTMLAICGRVTNVVLLFVQTFELK